MSLIDDINTPLSPSSRTDECRDVIPESQVDYLRSRKR